jgi:hypothetical protein
VRLGRGLSLAGRVLAADDKTPVQGAMVTVSPQQILLAPQLTEADGRFSFAGLLGDPLRLDVRANGFEAVSAGPFRPGAQLSDVLLPRKKTIALTGTVVEQGTNKKIAGAEISTGAGDSTRTDASGAFRHVVPASESFLLTITAPGYESYVESITLEGDGLPNLFALVPSDREAQLRAGLVSRIHGQVVDRDGKPLAGAIVDLRPAVPSMPQGIPGRAIVSGGFAADEARTQTDAEGKFALFTRQDGALIVTVTDAGGSVDQEVAVVRGSDRSLKIVGKR